MGRGWVCLYVCMGSWKDTCGDRIGSYFGSCGPVTDGVVDARIFLFEWSIDIGPLQPHGYQPAKASSISIAPLNRSELDPAQHKITAETPFLSTPAFMPLKSPSASSSHFPLLSLLPPPPHHHPVSSFSSPPSFPPHPAQNSKHQTQIPDTPDTFP